jgi:quercetin dioxygenase-like cupin family protein
MSVTAEATSIRPFRIDVPEEQLVEPRSRIAATRWPGEEVVADRSQGVQLATMQALTRYWATEYDWRTCEAKLNALPQFQTEIDGVDIHFIHVRSKHEGALPLVITHGWPGSVIEMLDVIRLLTDPAAQGGGVEDAFDVVVPSLPGYGFSGQPTVVGWGPDRVPRAWAQLMDRLGDTHYVAQGGDLGAAVTDTMAIQAPRGLAGIHLNFLRRPPLEVAAVVFGGAPVPEGLTDTERAALEPFRAQFGKGYIAEQGQSPQTIATSRPGRSPSCSRRSYGRPSSLCADRRIQLHRRQEAHMSDTVQQVPGIKRTDLQEHDLSVPGRMVIQNRVQLGPEAPAIRHKHPGEEIIYVLEGSLEYDIDGIGAKTYSAGEALMVPAETVHAVRNVGNGPAAELATYVVEKGKPFLVVVE